MSLWNFFFDSDYSQRNDIEDLKLKAHKIAAQQRSTTTDLQTKVEELEKELGELTLICRTLMTVLRDNGTLKVEALQDVMRKIDLEDGVLDGRVSKKAAMPPPPPPPTPRRPLPLNRAKR